MSGEWIKLMDSKKMTLFPFLADSDERIMMFRLPSNLPCDQEYRIKASSFSAPNKTIESSGFLVNCTKPAEQPPSQVCPRLNADPDSPMKVFISPKKYLDMWCHQEQLPALKPDTVYVVAYNGSSANNHLTI